MLRLKRVEIQGFKSFCDRTEMRFHGSGIAAIVGPNGCGKSNLSDAISWVLGEQSAKTLRGTRMEDVIFAGTRERKPLGAASVTLTLVEPSAAMASAAAKREADRSMHVTDSDGQNGTNGNGVNGHVSNGHASSGHGKAGHEASGTNGDTSNGHALRAPVHTRATGEITITRRLYRSGESEYLINGRSARLRDIQDLFMGTGLGPESYAIIEQGRIGQILSNKPQDRRAVIEEAAGVTKFKTRKRLAEAKLESAKQNLTRVFDILEEVGRQVNSLKRQASKAKRYEELHTELVAHLRVALTGRFQTLERSATKMALDLNMATSEFQALAVTVADKEQEQAKLQEQFFRTESDLTEGRKKLSDLRLEAERTRGRLENQSKQIGSIDERLTRSESETQEIEGRLTLAHRELETHAVALKELEEETERSRRRLASKNQEREQQQAELRQRERDMEGARQQALRFLGEASTLRNQLAQIDEYLAAIERDTSRARKEEQTATQDRERLDAVKKDISARIVARQLELQSIGEQRKEIEEDLSVRRLQRQEGQNRLEELRGEVSRQKARKQSLEEILSHRAYTTEAVKSLFTAIDLGRIEGLRPSGVLADFVEVTNTAYEKAAEEFLHEELEYVVVSSWDEAEKGIEGMRSDLDGRATFLLHPEPGHAVPCATASVPPAGEEGIIGPLSDVLRFTNGVSGGQATLLPRLSNCYLVRSRESARTLATEYPDAYFLLADGVSFHGRTVSGGQKTGSGPLALKRELRELMGMVRATEAKLGETGSALETLERYIARLSQELERLRAVQQSQEKDALALDHQHRKLAEEYANASSRLSVARLELERLERERSRSAEQRERSQQIVAEKEQARAAQEQSLTDARAEWERLQSELARLNEEHATLRAYLAGYEERRRSGRATQERLEAQNREFIGRREHLAREMERMGVDRAHLLADNIELDNRAAQLADAILSAEAGVSVLMTEEESLRISLAALDDALRTLRAGVQAAQEKRSQIELELVKKQEALKYLDETSRKELNTPVAELAGGEEIALDEDALGEMEQKYQDVRAKIENLGPVNTQALEEFQEAQQRYDFLNAQRQDLLDSIRDTEKAIHEIDTESRKRFSEAFAAINEHFREMFKTLFGGGSGEMRLTDETNVAESGIDMVAQPPGKKLQNVLLLSGGEKSLTAMALLMAIFRYQPSPFCILDEIDAPLDEPNIMRLTRLIRDMSAQTQFIVITHAKRTMEASQVLYGVTMQEPGVSKLVSVKFDPVPEPAEIVPAGV